MKDEEGIITINEFRRFAGKDADQFSDTQVRELILQLDFMAQLFIKKQRLKRKDTTASVSNND